MWNNFEKILEKRVQNKKTIANDKYVVIDGVKRVIKNKFGEMGEKFTEVKDYKNGTIWIGFNNSTWRNEFKLQEKELINNVNCLLKQDLIKRIILI
jgi:hypothetical protein